MLASIDLLYTNKKFQSQLNYLPETLYSTLKNLNCAKCFFFIKQCCEKFVGTVF